MTQAERIEYYTDLMERWMKSAQFWQDAINQAGSDRFGRQELDTANRNAERCFGILARLEAGELVPTPLEDAKYRVMQKARKAASEAIGKTFHMRLDKSTTFEGKIVICKADVVECGKSVKAVFHITVEGATGRRESGCFDRLPR